MISIAHQFLFIHIPKTGGNSIQLILQNYSEDEIVTKEDQDGIHSFGVRSGLGELKKHSMLVDYRQQLEPGLYEKLFKFTCVRNPWDRMISFYFSPRRKVDGWNREQFLDLLGRAPTYMDFLTTSKNGTAPEVDFAMRFERLQEDFNSVCQRIGIPSRQLPHSNPSSRKPYREYYDDELVAAVAERFQREIGCFGYEFGR